MCFGKTFGFSGKSTKDLRLFTHIRQQQKVFFGFSWFWKAFSVCKYEILIDSFFLCIKSNKYIRTSVNGPKKALQAALEGLETNDLRLKEDRTIVPSALEVCFIQGVPILSAKSNFDVIAQKIGQISKVKIFS